MGDIFGGIIIVIYQKITHSLVKLHFMGPIGKGMGMCKGPGKKLLSLAKIDGFVKEQETDKLF